MDGPLPAHLFSHDKLVAVNEDPRDVAKEEHEHDTQED
jgi:hypothetical protein